MKAKKVIKLSLIGSTIFLAAFVNVAFAQTTCWTNPDSGVTVCTGDQPQTCWESNGTIICQ